MKVSADYVVVGAGVTGAAVARCLADAGREVVVLERRDCVSGNCADAVHEQTGQAYHRYGPHSFKTNSDELWDWVRRFADFREWHAVVMTDLGDGRLRRWPLLQEDEHLRHLAVDEYNRKMWGTDAPPIEVKKRVVRRTDSDPRLRLEKHQGLPIGGYVQWVSNMLRGVPTVLNFDYLKRKADVEARVKLVYTGPVDALYGYDAGTLKYRCMRRVLSHLSGPTLPCFQVNYPLQGVGAIRRIEWNYFAESPSWDRGSLVTSEVPSDPVCEDEYEYPYNDRVNVKLKVEYNRRVRSDSKLLVCGRLGEYRYMDMDQAIARARVLARGITG